MSILHAKVIGEGSPLVILHGFLGMGDNWKSLGNRFATDGHQVHLVDQRNHGRSFHNAEFSYELMAQDVKRYCEANALEQIAVIGHSMGGKTAMQLAVTHPDLVNKLVVADIAPKLYPEHHHEILKGMFGVFNADLASRSQADAILSQYVKEAGVRQFLLKNLYWKDKQTLGLRVNLPALSDHYKEVGKPLDSSALYKGQSLFLRGDRSGYIEDQDQLLIKKHFPDSRLLTVSNAGHWLHAENPEEFYQNVIDFL
ncbi:MAG: alpha/beta fold hydrolase [Gilvibacter sp.]